MCSLSSGRGVLLPSALQQPVLVAFFAAYAPCSRRGPYPREAKPGRYVLASKTRVGQPLRLPESLRFVHGLKQTRVFPLRPIPPARKQGRAARALQGENVA